MDITKVLRVIEYLEKCVSPEDMVTAIENVLKHAPADDDYYILHYFADALR